jgi:hypothetical protein
MSCRLKANLSRKRKAPNFPLAADGFLSMTFDKFNTLKKKSDARVTRELDKLDTLKKEND